VIETRLTVVTVSVAVPEMLSAVAIMLVDPAATPIANPLEPVVVPIVAMEVSDELQSADVVMSCVVLSVKVPIAVNC